MGNLLLVVVCLVAGVVARRSGRLPASTPIVLGRIVINVALPALTIVAIRGAHLSEASAAHLAIPVLTPLAVFVVTFALIVPFGRWMGWDRRVVACLLLTAGLANTSFVGFPLVEALYGKAGLTTAVWVDQGQFLVLATIGVWIAAREAGGEPPTVSGVLRRLLSFPPFIAFVLALLLHDAPLPHFVVLVLEKLALLVVPFALLSVGWQLRLERDALATLSGPLAVGLALRLLVVPAVIAVVLASFASVETSVRQVTIVEAAMAPMITGALLAIDARLAPKLAGLMVGVGVPASLVTVPAWAWLLARVMG